MALAGEDSVPVSGQPRLSVVVPAFDNGPALDVMLDSLTRQTMPAAEFEVIVGDDGSSVPLAPVVDKYTDRLDVTCVRSDNNRGRSANRNAAAHRALAAALLFLDSDTVAHPDLLRRHWSFHGARSAPAGPRRPGVLLGWRYEIDWAAADALRRGQPVSPAMVDGYRADLRDADYAQPHHRRDFARAPWVFGFSHNASVDRESFVAVGGFDEAMVKWGLEDLELFYRIFHHHGGRPDVFELDRDALSYHLPHYRPTQHTLAVLDNMKYLVRKHPRYDIEALYSPSSLGRYLGRVRLYGDAVAACRREGLGRPSLLPAALRQALSARRALVIGFGVAELDLADGSHTFDHDAPPSETNWHLLGLVWQYFKTGQFALLINIDLWRFFTPEDLCAFVTGALRKADEVQLVASRASPDQAELLPLPFIADIEYAAQMLRPHFRVDVTTHEGGATVVIVR